MMKELRLNIDGREVTGYAGQTILDVARANEISIPTLCFDERTQIYGACGLCVVELEGFPKPVKACATEIAPNMVVFTNTDRVRELRKTNLELLLSNHKGDCVAPCKLNCPAGTDCQGYVGLVANGRFDEAIELIREKIPLPASIGRVCPHPCETACRRGLQDEPISIATIKRFAADWDMMSETPFSPEVLPETGKKIAIIGGGPYGLSAAYFLRQKGHAVSIFEAMPKLGGMLRYGIPEYRLPKSVIDAEVATIEKMGVNIYANTKVGTDISFESIRRDHDAVLIGVGAWVSTGVGCPGEDSEGVLGGIDFLRKIVKHEDVQIGKNVAVVGGGNTAMDATRTAIRLGAENVYNIYRRTKAEMPAEEIEIIEAEEEGAIFKNLTNPLEIRTNENGRVCEIELQIMELGEPDASGRRAPKAVEGKTETLAVDTVILAIGQSVSTKGIDGLELTRKGGIVYDKATFRTSLEGVFCGGDCGNDKISIAVEAIADAQKVTEIVDSYLNGKDISYEKPYVVERDDITEKTFEDRERQCRPHAAHRSPENRNDNFNEIVFGYEPHQALEDSKRCLECGCHDFHECKLVSCANDYDVKPERFDGEKLENLHEDDHPFFQRDPNKCILCGLCVRVCDEVMGVGALGLVRRGFDAVVKPALEGKLEEAGCISCGQCVSVCPTGALGERLSIEKSVPLKTNTTKTTCSFCSIGCSIVLHEGGGMILKSTPDKEGAVNSGLLCARGRFGFDCAEIGEILEEPIMREEGQLYEVDYHDAIIRAAKKLESVATRYGKDAVALAVSDRLTNEEAYAIKQFGDKIGAKTICLNHRISGVSNILGINRSPNTIDELLSTNTIIVVGYKSWNSIMRAKLLKAQENGAKIFVITTENLPENLHLGTEILVKNDAQFLAEMLKATLDLGKTSSAANFEEFRKSLENIEVSELAKMVTESYINSKKAMILYDEKLLSTTAAEMVSELALLSGHIGKARDGIVQIRAKNNTQGLINLGITEGEEALANVKAIMSFGEIIPLKIAGNLEFYAISDTHLHESASLADVIFPAVGASRCEGTFTNTEGRLQAVQAAYPNVGVLETWELAKAMADVFEIKLNFDDTSEISREMETKLPFYRDAKLGIAEGVLAPQNPKFVPVNPKAVLEEPVCPTDNLTRLFNKRVN